MITKAIAMGKIDGFRSISLIYFLLSLLLKLKLIHLVVRNTSDAINWLWVTHLIDASFRWMRSSASYNVMPTVNLCQFFIDAKLREMQVSAGC